MSDSKFIHMPFGGESVLGAEKHKDDDGEYCLRVDDGVRQAIAPQQMPGGRAGVCCAWQVNH